MHPPFKGDYTMKVIAKYHALYDPPLLQLWIHDAPHRRMHIKTIQQYRKFLYEAVRHTSIGNKMPIDFPIELDVLFVNPSSPDIGNIYLALEQAMDNTTLTKPGIVMDDGLIQKITVAKYFNSDAKK
jgi:Holliday junction resolvase RusA-like endonuclease